MIQKTMRHALAITMGLAMSWATSGCSVDHTDPTLQALHQQRRGLIEERQTVVDLYGAENEAVEQLRHRLELLDSQIADRRRALGSS